MAKAGGPSKTLQKPQKLTPVVHESDDGLVILDKVRVKKTAVIQLAVEDRSGDKVVVHFSPGDFSMWLRKAAKV